VGMIRAGILEGSDPAVRRECRGGEELFSSAVKRIGFGRAHGPRYHAGTVGELNAAGIAPRGSAGSGLAAPELRSLASVPAGARAQMPELD